MIVGCVFGFIIGVLLMALVGVTLFLYIEAGIAPFDR